MGIGLKRSGGFGVIMIENAGKFNAMNREMFEELEVVLAECERDDAISVIMLTGQGANFCAGFDVGEIYQLSMSDNYKEADRHIRGIRGVVEHLASSSKPTIAVIDGVCLGGGLELALACSFRIVSERARFGFPEISLGLIPGLGGTQRLARLIPLKEALEILLAGRDRMLPARKAMELGLVDEVAPSVLIHEAKRFAQEVRDGTRRPRKLREETDTSLLDALFLEITARAGKKSSIASESILASLRSLPLSLQEGLALEHIIFLGVLFSEEAKISMRKFLKIPEERALESVSPAISQGSLESKEANIADSSSLSMPFCVDLPEEFRMLRDLARQFARERIAPQVKAMEAAGRIPRELFREVGELGFLGLVFPAEYGGSEMSRHGMHIWVEEFSRVHASCGVAFGAHLALACGAIYFWGNEAQKQAYLAPAIRGEKIGAFALTEPDAGSDVAGLRTFARRDGAHWVLNGSKTFITNGTIADFVVVFAQTDPLGGNRTLVAFIVDRDTPGFSAQSAGEKIGLRASDTATLYFDNVRLHAEKMLGQVGDGFKVAMTALNGSRLGICAIALGEAKEAFELASQYTALREIEGEPLYMKQTIQQHLAEMSLHLLAMEAMIHWVTSKVDSGKDMRREIAETKVFCTEYAQKVIDTALQIFGGVGYMDETPVARIWRDARVNRIFDGTSEINRLLAAKEIIKNIVAGRSALDRS